MSKVDLYMPFWVGDYLADTMHLTTEQHGAYVLLILAYWRNGQSLPNDENYLRTLVKFSPHKWKNNSQIILKFFEVKGDFLYHGRIEKEIKIAHEKRDKAKKSASARWGENGGEQDANAYANAYANASPKHMRSQCYSYINTNKSKPRAKPNNYSSERKNKLLEQFKAAGGTDG